MSPCGVVNCKAFGPQGSLLTNRMTQLVTYGSVGGVGRKPGPYPALHAAITSSLYFGGLRRCASEPVNRKGVSAAHSHIWRRRPPEVQTSRRLRAETRTVEYAKVWN